MDFLLAPRIWEPRDQPQPGSYRSERGGVAVSGDKTLCTRLWPRQREAKIHTVNCLIQVNCEVYWEIINTTNVILDISNHYDKY